MCLQTGKVSNHFSGLLCLRIYHVFLCDKNRLESNSILNISIRSFTQTYKDELTLMVGASLRLAGRYEPYRLISRWLNVIGPGRCAPWEAQGVDSANS